ncbi:MAG: 3-deoxy-8-phosphooctulonate synthase [Planctomycetes bacterium]|nr:3-deoxy-8-phosphooctulonate synthase [Planctomycetota bacterium]
MNVVEIGPVRCGQGKPLFFIGGPDVIESEAHAFRHARAIRDICAEIELPFIFKCSYDKANRTSGKAFRGPGARAGLAILRKIRSRLKVPVLTDVHSPDEARAAAKAVDVLQVPAFLCRQTDLVTAAAKTGRALHIKKGQFMAPWDMKNVLDKATSAGNSRVMLCERGASFGYNTLVVDMRSIPLMKRFGHPVVFDAGHSVQVPSGGPGGTASGGDRTMIPILARAGVAAGADGVFMEVHEDPDHAPCDGPNSLKLADLPAILKSLVAIRHALRDGHVQT